MNEPSVQTVAELSMEYCTRCGRPEHEGGHAGCQAALTLEPPRYCSLCRRRMVVQVVPTGWTARCSVHGELHS